jgi:hypothetical protein
MTDKVYCESCGKECPPPRSLLGCYYGKTAEGKIRCFTCCAEEDKAQMDRLHMDHTGKICMYLTHRPFPMHNDRGAQKWIMGTTVAGTLTNWPGTLSFPCRVKIGRHNIARYRYDVWFTDHNGNPWHGVTYGEKTQICHCHRIKGR